MASATVPRLFPVNQLRQMKGLIAKQKLAKLFYRILNVTQGSGAVSPKAVLSSVRCSDYSLQHRFSATLATEPGANGPHNTPVSPSPSGGFFDKRKALALALGTSAVAAYFLWRYKSSDDYSSIMNKIHSTVIKAHAAVNNKKYKEAQDLYQEAVQLAKEKESVIGGSGKNVVLGIVDQLANLAYELDDFTEAETLFKEVLQRMVELDWAKDDDALIEVSLKLAKIYQAQGRHEFCREGLEFCVQSLDTKIKSSKEVSTDTLTLYGMCLTEYGTYCKEFGMLDQSEEALSKALNIAKQVLGPTHEQTSVLANDLATVYDEKGRYNKAERLLCKAIRIAKQTAPENLPAYQYNLGAILMHKGEFDRARKALRKALELAEESEDEETKELIKSSMMKLDVDV